MPGLRRVRETAGGLLARGGEAEDESPDRGEPGPDTAHPEDSDTGSEGLRQRLFLCPTEMPGVHALVKVTGDAVGQVVDVGVGLPRAAIEHARHRPGSDVVGPPEIVPGDAIAGD